MASSSSSLIVTLWGFAFTHSSWSPSSNRGQGGEVCPFSAGSEPALALWSWSALRLGHSITMLPCRRTSGAGSCAEYNTRAPAFKPSKVDETMIAAI
jgi:hypothetical protein